MHAGSQCGVESIAATRAEPSHGTCQDCSHTELLPCAFAFLVGHGAPQRDHQAIVGYLPSDITVFCSPPHSVAFSDSPRLRSTALFTAQFTRVSPERRSGRYVASLDSHG